MSLTITEARNEILTLFRTAWLAQGSPPPLYFWDTTADPPTDPSWVLVIVRHADGGNDAIGNTLFSREGLVTVQIMTEFGEGLTLSDALTKVALDAFQGKATPGGVWFRNVRAREVGPDGQWFHVNVLAEFEYTERI